MDILDIYAIEIIDLQEKLNQLYSEIEHNYSSQEADKVIQEIVEG